MKFKVIGEYANKIYNINIFLIFNVHSDDKNINKNK